MTLLELLVKELPKRGGWPDGAFKYCAYNGFACAYLRNEQEVYKSLISGICESICGTVYFHEYEAAIAAQQPVWDGNGLPPVGCVCEWKDFDRWLKVEVMFSSKWAIVIRSMENNAGFGVDVAIDLVKDKFADLSFRPIRTEADRKREEAIDAILSLGVFTRPVAEKTVDAIAAGKIPGVELTK